MYAAVIQGTITLASSSGAKGATAKKSTASAGKRKGASKVAEEASSNQETIPFISKEEIKSQIRAINEELPDEILDLLTDNLYRYILLFTEKIESIVCIHLVLKVIIILIYLFNVLKKVLH